MKPEPTIIERKADVGCEGRGRTAQLALVMAFGVGLALAWSFTARTQTLLAAGLEALLAWRFLAGLAQLLYPRRDVVTAGGKSDSWLSFPYAGQALTLAFAAL